jgi:hypothetical protein
MNTKTPLTIGTYHHGRNAGRHFGINNNTLKVNITAIDVQQLEQDLSKIVIPPAGKDRRFEPQLGKNYRLIRRVSPWQERNGRNGVHIPGKNRFIHRENGEINHTQTRTYHVNTFHLRVSHFRCILTL